MSASISEKENQGIDFFSILTFLNFSTAEIFSVALGEHRWE